MKSNLTTTTAKIDVSGLRSGMYLIQIQFEDQSTVFKIVKE